MKNFKLLIPLLTLIFYSCQKDEVQEEEEGENTVSEISLTPAFPELSFVDPMDIESPNDGTNRIFVAERSGIIRVFSNDENTNETKIFINLPGRVNNSLFSLAFDPNYATNGYFYVAYNGGTFIIVERFQVSSTDPDLADEASGMGVMQITQPRRTPFGVFRRWGDIAFGPDGYLYIAVGESGDKEASQSKSSMLGKIHRIDVSNLGETESNYNIPRDNPFVGEPNVREEIFAYGFSHPRRISFDSQTGQLWAGDQGGFELDEINVVESGGNYGWDFWEGTFCFYGDCTGVGITPPLFSYKPEKKESIIGGYVYRGSELSSLQGKYVYGDRESGQIWALNANGSDNMLLGDSFFGVNSFGTDSSGELYVCSSTTILKLTNN